MNLDEFSQLERGTLLQTPNGRVGRLKQRDDNGFGNIVTFNDNGDTWETGPTGGYVMRGVHCTGVDIIDPSAVEFVSGEWRIKE